MHIPKDKINSPNPSSREATVRLGERRGRPKHVPRYLAHNFRVFKRRETYDTSCLPPAFLSSWFRQHQSNGSSGSTAPSPSPSCPSRQDSIKQPSAHSTCDDSSIARTSCFISRGWNRGTSALSFLKKTIVWPGALRSPIRVPSWNNGTRSLNTSY